jgi:hypothetical protein
MECQTLCDITQVEEEQESDEQTFERIESEEDTLNDEEGILCGTKLYWFLRQIGILPQPKGVRGLGKSRSVGHTNKKAVQGLTKSRSVGHTNKKAVQGLTKSRSVGHGQAHTKDVVH